MTLNITHDMVDTLIDISKRAGVEIMKIYNTDFQVDSKADQSPVTAADRISEALITKAIGEEVTDAFPIIGEEAFADGTAPKLDEGPFWLVDALDGTKQFVSKNGEFTVNIALIETDAPVLGIIHAPALGVTYWGSHIGSFSQNAAGVAKPIQCRPFPEAGITAVASRSHRSEKVDEYLSKLDIAKEVTSGSSIKFCMVSDAQADIYPRFGRTMEWDTAAGHAIVRYAGGSVTNTDGSPFVYRKPGFENPDFIAKGA